MMKILVPIVFLALLLSGCSPQIIPQTSAQVSLGADKETVSATDKGLTLSVKLQDLDFGPYTGENNITAFYVKLSNDSNKEYFVPLSAFMLFDQDRRLYRPLDSDRVTALSRQEANFLIPYPYVGFYYLQDSVDFDFATQSASSFAYSPKRSTTSVDAYALPVGKVPAGANIAGMIFFNIDLYDKNSIDLVMQLPGEENIPETKFSFLFNVVK